MAGEEGRRGVDALRAQHVHAGRGLGDVERTGDPAALDELLGLLDTPDPDFPIVTP